MKKFSLVCLLVMVALTLGGCRAFDDTQTKQLPEADPQAVTVKVTLKDGVRFDPLLFTQLIYQIQTTPVTDDQPHIKTARFSSTEQDGTTTYYCLELTLAALPDQEVTLVTRPFTITRTYRLYNPLQLLPASEVFNYYLAVPSTKRYYRTTALTTQKQSDGSYLYWWSTTATLDLTEQYPNRPLYYLLTIAAAGGLAVIVYLLSRARFGKL